MFESHDCESLELAEDVAVDTEVCRIVVTDADAEEEFNILRQVTCTVIPSKGDSVFTYRTVVY